MVVTRQNIESLMDDVLAEFPDAAGIVQYDGQSGTGLLSTERTGREDVDFAGTRYSVDGSVRLKSSAFQRWPKPGDEVKVGADSASLKTRLVVDVTEDPVKATRVLTYSDQYAR